MTRRDTWMPWPQADSDKLYNLCHCRSRVSEKLWAYIASHFPGRTVVACKQQYGKLKAKAEGRPPRIRMRSRQANNRYVIHNPEDRALKQNPVRLPEPASITALLCGDPLPGRSALDEKRMKEQSTHG